ncbi:MAG TPA: DNA polymerase III subunit delta [Thermaerobacter sp.]
MDAREALAAIDEGRIQPVYLLYGPEAYWKDAIIRKLRQRLLPAGDHMNLSVFEDGRVPVQAILEQATTVPLLAERRLVIVRNSELLQGRGERADEEALSAYLEDPVTTTCLVFRQDGDVDGRRPLIKRFRERGYAVDCQPLRDAALAEWLQDEAGRLGKTLRPEAVAWLVESGEPDLYRLSNELHKAAAHAGERPEITGDDVRAVGIAATTAAVFDLVDAIAEKRRAAALQLLGRLLAAGEPPLRLLALVARQFRILAHARALMDRGATQRDLQERLGLHPFVARKAWQQARRLGADESMEALEAILETDVAIKQGRWPDRLALERMVLLLTTPGPWRVPSRPAI